MRTRVLVASTGGHLTELVMLAPRLTPPAEREVWVTFDSGQSRRLLRGKEVVHVRETPPRDLVNVVRNVPAARKVLLDHSPDQLVTNGAGIALSFAPMAAAMAVDTHYIECSARTRAPSVTGSVLQRVPRVRCYAQDPAFEGPGWTFSGSVFDGFESRNGGGVSDLRKVVVTVGSLDFSFLRLIRRLEVIVPRDVELLVQAGVDVAAAAWPGATAVASMPPDVMDREMAGADVVVAHGGIGSALAALTAGKAPVLVPRRKRFGEHVDDHQEQIARTLDDRGLAVCAEADALTLEDLQRCARRDVVGIASRPFHLLGRAAPPVAQ